MEMMVSILSDLISSTIKLLSEEHVPSVRSLWSWPPTSDDNDDADEEVTVVIGMGSVSVRPSRGGVKTTGIYSSASRGNFEFLKCCFNASKPCSHFQTSYFKNKYIYFFLTKIAKIQSFFTSLPIRSTMHFTFNIIGQKIEGYSQNRHWNFKAWDIMCKQIALIRKIINV